MQPNVSTQARQQSREDPAISLVCLPSLTYQVALAIFKFPTPAWLREVSANVAATLVMLLSLFGLFWLLVLVNSHLELLWCNLFFRMCDKPRAQDGSWGST